MTHKLNSVYKYIIHLNIFISADPRERQDIMHATEVFPMDILLKPLLILKSVQTCSSLTFELLGL